LSGTGGEKSAGEEGRGGREERWWTEEEKGMNAEGVGEGIGEDNDDEEA
jgi:hypothetical protein